MKLALIASALTISLIGVAAVVTLEPTPARAESQLRMRPHPITFAVAGDSITAWHNLSFPHPTSDPDRFDPITWTHYAILDGLRLAGGYARGGKTIGFIADSMVPVDADVLVVMASTNDVVLIDPATLEGYVERIVATSGVRTVIVCAIPPFGRYGGAWDEANVAARHNAEFQRMAAEHGWSYVDPWVGVRAADQKWLPGYSIDLVHPTAPAAEMASVIIVAKIRELHAAAVVDSLRVQHEIAPPNR